MKLRSIDRKDAVVFIVGLLAMIKFRIMGTFSAGEIVAIASIPFVSPLAFMKSRKMRIYVGMLCVWLVGVILSNIWNDTSTENSLKGAFNVVFLILLTPFIYWAFRDKMQRILYFWMGYGVSALVSWRDASDLMTEYDAGVWLIYGLVPGAVAVASILYYRGYRVASMVTIEVFALWTLFAGSRHVFLVMNIALILMLVWGKVTESNRMKKQAGIAKKWGVTLLLIGAGGAGVSVVYTSLAKSGHLGERAKVKYEVQSRSNVGLASGRIDFFISLYTIEKSPIFGYGSYAMDQHRYADTYIKTHENGSRAPWNRKRKKIEMMHGHSYLLGAWVYSGILGAIFWIYVICVMVKFIKYGILYRPRLLMYFLLETSMMMWNILFSPFADRIIFASYFVCVLLTLQELPQRIKNGKNIYLIR